MHIVLFILSERTMDLNQKTLVSQEYCTEFVDSRHRNLRTSLIPRLSAHQEPGYEAIYGLAIILFVLLATEKVGWGNAEGRKLILLFTVQSMHLMCKKKSFL